MPVTVRRKAANKKLAPVKLTDEKHGCRRRPEPQGPFVSATYVSINATCPRSCPFLNAGCFVQAGFTKMLSDRLDREARGMSALLVARAEARAIDDTFKRGVPQDGARGGRDLRLHVGGDCGSPAGVRALAGAAERWRARGGGVVWTYTHHWRTVPREAWGAIAVLASVESVADIKRARRCGYPAAVIVDSFPTDKRFNVDGEPIIPCPAETRGKTCVECRLCLRPNPPASIGFAIHGRFADRAKKTLKVLP